MPHEKIINYYLLCSVASGKLSHPMNDLAKKELDALLTKKEQEEFLKTLNGKLVANETIVGGSNDETDTSILQFINHNSSKSKRQNNLIGLNY